MCLFALLWPEIKHKTREYQGENLFLFIKCVTKRLWKGKERTCRWGKNESTGGKVLKQLFNILNFRVCTISSYRKLQLIAMNKLGKVWFHGKFLIKFCKCSIMNFKSLEQLWK